MAQWFKNVGGLRRFVASLGVTACVTAGVAFGQYSNQYQNNINSQLEWRAPAIHGQQTTPSQPVQHKPSNPSHVQLVQHLEPAQTPPLMPTVDTIDNTSTPTVAPPPVGGTRVAQVPGPGASPAARLDTMMPQTRPGYIGRQGNPGVTSPAPNINLGDNSYGDIEGSGARLSTLTPPGSARRITECGDPRNIGVPMGQVDINIDLNIAWDKLDPCPINVEDYRPRYWPLTCMQYNAPILCTSAAYFEDVAVERYGHSWGPFLQPVMSAAHFYGSVLFLPYKMGLTPPCECVYTLGYYRPGSCAPYMIDPIPFSLRAGVAQAGAVVGLAYAIP